MLKFIVSYFLLALWLQSAAVQPPPPPPPPPTKQEISLLPDGPGKAIVVKSCTSCHTISSVIKKRGNEDEWADTVSKMIGRGAILTDDDADTLVEYLAAHYGPPTPKPSSVNSAK